MKCFCWRGEVPIQWESLFLFGLLKWEKNESCNSAHCLLNMGTECCTLPRKLLMQHSSEPGTAPTAQKQTLHPLLLSGKISSIPGQLFSCPKYSVLQSPLFLCFQRNFTSWLMYLQHSLGCSSERHL